MGEGARFMAYLSFSTPDVSETLINYFCLMGDSCAEITLVDQIDI